MSQLPAAENALNKERGEEGVSSEDEGSLGYLWEKTVMEEISDYKRRASNHVILL